MKKSDLNQTLRTINMIRKEKTPPVLAYCVLLALAEANKPVGQGYLCKVLEEPTFAGGTLDRLVDKGKITVTKSEKRINLYSLTQLGMDEAKRLVAGQKLPTPNELREATEKLARIKLVAAAKTA